MKTQAKGILIVFFVINFFNCVFAQNSNRKNEFWPVSSPEEQGLSSIELNNMFDYIAQNKTRVHSIQIIRHGHLILDAYFYPYDGQTKHDIASVTKSITSTLVGIAIDRNYIPSIKSHVLDYFPEYDIEDTLKSKITLEDLITMRSGFDCGTILSDPKINADNRLAEIRKCDDWIKCILTMPMRSQPGERFAYCNANCHLMLGILRKATGMSASDFAQKELFGPLGINDYYWPADAKGINYGWGDLQLYPYDMLKIGELMLHQGKISNVSVISQNWLQNATKIHVTFTGGNDKYGYYWWIPGDNYPGVFEAVGRGGQRITVWPANDMVIVFTGGGFETSSLIGFIINAIKSDTSITANQVAFKQLKLNTSNALNAPHIEKRTKEQPPMALIVSDTNYHLQANSMNLDKFKITFNNSNEAKVNMIWNGENVTVKTGLDGIERYSSNSLTKLPQTATAKWITDTSLLFKLDLVGAINLYNLKINFTEKGKKIIIDLSEGTGLNNERIMGEAIKYR